MATQKRKGKTKIERGTKKQKLKIILIDSSHQICTYLLFQANANRDKVFSS